MSKVISYFRTSGVLASGAWSRRGFAVSLFVVATHVYPPGSAHAAVRSVCMEIGIQDARGECPTPGTAGAQRPCKARTTYSNPVGAMVKLWDKDSGSGSGDDFIGTFRLGGEGSWCFDFEWEGSSASMGEAHPDVYITMDNRVQVPFVSNSPEIALRRADNSAYPTLNWRDGTAANPDAWVAVNCSGTCTILPGGLLIPVPNVAEDHAVGWMALDSAQHTMSAYSGELAGRTMSLETPTSENNCSTACAPDRGGIHSPISLADEGFRIAHEMGHILQMDLLVRDIIRNDCTANNQGGWLYDSVEFDSCATQEGWATYVAAVAWWNPGNVNSRPTSLGFNFETAAPLSTTCSLNRGLVAQVARGFWDLDDANNEDGAGAAAGSHDRSSITTSSLAAIWERFPDGTADRQDFESGANGVNAKDYRSNGTLSTTGIQSFLQHNCFDNQEEN